MPTTVLWFRRDLRLSDNPALIEAIHRAGRDGAVVPLFVLDDRLRAAAGPPRVAYLSRTLRALDASIGGRLVIRAGPPAATLAGLAAEVGAEAVLAAEDFGPYGRRRDGEVVAELDRAGM